MLPLERQNKILEILSKKQAVTVDELCARLYSSGATIRRDLQALESNGLLRRTHGGAVFVDGNARDFPLTMRETENLIPKSIIAKRALPYIHEGQTLFMDASSTVCQLAEKLTGFQHLRVITNGLKTANILSEIEGVEVYGTGGRLRENAKSFVGRRPSNSSPGSRRIWPFSPAGGCIPKPGRPTRARTRPASSGCTCAMPSGSSCYVTRASWARRISAKSGRWARSGK